MCNVCVNAINAKPSNRQNISLASVSSSVGVSRKNLMLVILPIQVVFYKNVEMQNIGKKLQQNEAFLAAITNKKLS